MTYVRKYHKPDIFTTFTCNPKWREISETLLPNQSSHDRPDLVSRVFHMKLKDFIKDLTKNAVFGKPKAHLYSVEYQKRGLPHAHVLLWLEERIHLQEIDSIISAEIASKDDDPELHRIILSHMVHGPCGPQNPRSPCMQNGLCSKHYPREFLSETLCGNDGYPEYRRRSKEEGGFEEEKRTQNGSFVIDNRWVVPHNRYLCKKYDAHINVEYCSSIRSIQYVLKYVHKGCDMASFALQRPNPRDEIDVFRAARYIGPSEACWRLFDFPIHERYPPVQTLHVHTSDDRQIVFTPENARQRAEDPPDTTLTAFFKLCATYYSNDNAQFTDIDRQFVANLLYSEVPQYFTWNSGKHQWMKRKKGAEIRHNGATTSFLQTQMIGRIYTVHPKQEERFFVRLLLNTVKGPKSFTDLRTVRGNVASSFKQACKDLHLLEDDNHWIMCMSEASESRHSSALRVLFAVLLASCQLTDALQMWMRFRNDMADDIRYQFETGSANGPIQPPPAATRRPAAPRTPMPFTDQIYNHALLLLQKTLNSMGGNLLSAYGLPTPDNTHSQGFYILLLA